MKNMLKTISLLYYIFLLRGRTKQTLINIMTRIHQNGMSDLYMIPLCDNVTIINQRAGKKELCSSCPLGLLGSNGCGKLRTSELSNKVPYSTDQLLVSFKTFLLFKELALHIDKFLFIIPRMFGHYTRFAKYLAVLDAEISQRSIDIFEYMNRNGLKGLQQKVDEYELEYLLYYHNSIIESYNK